MKTLVSFLILLLVSLSACTQMDQLKIDSEYIGLEEAPNVWAGFSVSGTQLVYTGIEPVEIQLCTYIDGVRYLVNENDDRRYQQRRFYKITMTCGDIYDLGNISSVLVVQESGHMMEFKRNRPYTLLFFCNHIGR